MCALRVAVANPREQNALGDWCGVPGTVLPLVAVDPVAADDVIQHHCAPLSSAVAACTNQP
jgi:hypothetical protein